jgi:hypothetical protein
MTGAGFPHSEIFGYNACLPLPEAYRSLLRPSSPVDAKAFADGCNWFMQTLVFKAFILPTYIN